MRLPNYLFFEGVLSFTKQKYENFNIIINLLISDKSIKNYQYQ